MTDELLELETGFWSSAGDGDFYREHMAAHGLCVLPVGMMGKDETVAAIEESTPWAEFELTDVTTLDLGDDEAALCYRAEASRAEGPHSYKAMLSSVYTRLSGRWKLTLHQQTPLG
ncbi:MAG TPA: nuclear transport factor 2 family protein [Acidimicrobiia bacterium]|nr:nuclear transport factor 2 family protein [Acidimicrobiia bacterium]